MITILCSGSRGDIQPYIGLAQALQKLGKKVRIASGKSFGEFVQEYGVDFYALSADYQTVDIDPQLLKDAQSSDNPLKMLLTFNKMKKYAAFMTEEMYKACEGSELIVYHPGCTIGYFAAEKLGIPSVLASPFPMHKTAEVPSIITYGRNKLPYALTYSLLQGMLWMASKTGVESYLKARFKSLPSKFGAPYKKVDSQHPAVISCSNFVFPTPQDWSQYIHQKGYWFVEEAKEYEPSKELSAFLQQEEKPIYIGFGSVFNAEEREELLALIENALHRCNKRAVISGMGVLPAASSRVFGVNSVPHTWLFPRMGAVCHHGGAGTSAAGFRAGVPSVIVPFSNDQFAWAHRAYDLGVGAQPVYKKHLTADALANAIEESQHRKIVSNAAALAKNIASENGARDCAEVIVKLLEKNSPE